MWGLVLLLLLIPALAEAQTVVWFSGAEDGSILGTEWESWCAGLTGQSSVDTTIKNSGHGSYKLVSLSGGGGHNECAAHAIAGSPTTIYGRFALRVDYSTSGGAAAFPHAIAYGFRPVGSHPHLCLFITAAHLLAWGNQSCTVAVATGSTTIADDTWYVVEYKMVISTTVGGMEVKVNGNVEFTSFGTNTGSSSFSSVGFGPGDPPVTQGTDYFDDIMVCTGAYCPSGRVLARQGAAGTPTYDTWTKTSCTGSVIDGCWSDTPYSATSNANSATATNAQTMLVHDFATTQTGHGTETVGGGSTINACKTAMVAKSGTAAAPVSIRRRISGADTDTAMTLTTSDAFYIDGIWTTTATVLRGPSMEIGVLHGAGVATDTVEDMWLMCDYLDVSAAIRHRSMQD